MRGRRRIDLITQGIVALCKTGQAATYADEIFNRLNKAKPEAAPACSTWLRLAGVADEFVHTAATPQAAKEIADRCCSLLNSDLLVSRELAIVFAHCRKVGLTDKPVHAALLKAPLAAKGDRPQQIHYFYCLRLSHEGWTQEEKAQLLEWFNGTQGWTGGASFTHSSTTSCAISTRFSPPTIGCKPCTRRRSYPKAATALVRLAPPEHKLPVGELSRVYDRLDKGKPGPGSDELKGYIVRAMVKVPVAENWPYLVRGLQSSDKTLLLELVEARSASCRTSRRPRSQATFPRSSWWRPADFDEKDQKNRWSIVELLRHWGNNKQLGADDGDAKRS